MSNPAVWTESLSVRAADLTPEGVASVPALCVYLQEAAAPHAAALGVSRNALAEEGRAWVLSRLRMEVERRPHRRDTVAVETWPSGLDGLYATREFEMTVNEALAVRATSAWFLIDVERRRPVRPPHAVRAIDPPDRARALPHADEDLSPPDRVDYERTVAVGYHDLDRNEHVNNVRYLTWALDTLPRSVHDALHCTTLDLDFRAEATEGDTVHATAAVEEGDNALQSRHLVQDNEDRTLAVAHTTWAPR